MRLAGYRTDVSPPAGWRRMFVVVWVAGAVLAFAWALRTFHAGPAHTNRNIQIAARLDDFTRSADPRTRNTIAPFLALPGLLGAMPRDAAPGQPIRAVKETELQHGFCTPTLARLVRYEYPGFYERTSDARLEKLAVTKYPEYKSKVCLLSVFVEADASDIVKYTVRPRSLVNKTARSFAALLASLAFALAGLNVYFRAMLAWPGWRLA